MAVTLGPYAQAVKCTAWAPNNVDEPGKILTRYLTCYGFYGFKGDITCLVNPLVGVEGLRTK